MSSTLMGLDLSATAAAACAIPLDWNGDFNRFRTCVVGEPLRRGASDEERARRCERMIRAHHVDAKGLLQEIDVGAFEPVLSNSKAVHR
jgi:hypothetical protein